MASSPTKGIELLLCFAHHHRHVGNRWAGGKSKTVYTSRPKNQTAWKMKDNKWQEEEGGKVWWRGSQRNKIIRQKSYISSPLWIIGKRTTPEHQQINPCAYWRGAKTATDFANFEKSLGWPLTQQSFSWYCMFLSLRFPFYGLGFISIRPKRKHKALGLFVVSDLGNPCNQVTQLKNPS